MTVETAIGLIRFGASLLFGVSVSVLFAGIGRTRRNGHVVGGACVMLLIVQYACLRSLGLDLTSKLYPVMIHLPMILLFSLFFKRPWMISIASVLSAYLCCQAPRWIGFLAGEVFGSSLADHLSYIAACLLAYYFLKRYVAGSVRQLLEKSLKSSMLLGAVPALYYLFDYVTIIYTDILYRGARWAVQFMPSAVSVFYFVFVILYFAETQKQARAQREREMLDVQLQLAKTEFAMLRKLQEHAAVYRHDMRHHFAHLQRLAVDGNLEGVREYLGAAQSDMEAITPVRFCMNETANLILSDFSARAAQKGVTLSVEADLPEKIPLSDTEFCSLLSNSLENAIAAAAACDAATAACDGTVHATSTAAGGATQGRHVTLKAQIHRNKLLISTENAYTGEIEIKGGIPRTSSEGNGFGSRSIAAIAEAHGGQAIFSAADGVFNLKVMLPLGE